MLTILNASFVSSGSGHNATVSQRLSYRQNLRCVLPNIDSIFILESWLTLGYPVYISHSEYKARTCISLTPINSHPRPQVSRLNCPTSLLPGNQYLPPSVYRQKITVCSESRVILTTRHTFTRMATLRSWCAILPMIFYSIPEGAFYVSKLVDKG